MTTSKLPSTVEAAHNVETLVALIEANLSRVVEARAEHAQQAGRAAPKVAPR